MHRSIDAVLIKGDGIGTEIIDATTDILAALPTVSFNWEEHYAGLEYYERFNEIVPNDTLQAIQNKGLALKGPFTTYSGKGQRSANWHIRRELDLYVCMRPIVSHSKGIDILLIRENTEDLYGAIEWETGDSAFAVKVATTGGCERIATYAFQKAVEKSRNKITVAHKANNLKKTEGMFLEVAQRIGEQYAMIQTNDQLIDSLAADVVMYPEQYDVILTTNTFGDILSSLGAGLLGSHALVPSASINRNIVLVEGAHGSAPELKGENVANPTGLILASALLLDEIKLYEEARMIRQAIENVSQNGISTPDSGGKASTTEFAQEIKKELRELGHVIRSV